MPVFKGTTSTSAVSTAYDISAEIKSFSIVHKGGGSAANINVSILFGSTNTYIYSGSLASGATYTDDVMRLLPAGYMIYVLSDHEVDYYFTIN